MDKPNRARWSSSSFGRYLDYPMPEDCNVIILGVMKYQIHPLVVLLPHQVYRHNLQRLLVEHETDEVFIIPYRSADVLSFKAEALFPRRAIPAKAGGGNG